MNGGEQKIYAAVQCLQVQMAQIQTKQEERHAENKQDLKIIFKKLTRLDNLPCAVHIEKMAWLSKGLYILYGVVVILVGWIVMGKI